MPHRPITSSKENKQILNPWRSARPEKVKKQRPIEKRIVEFSDEYETSNSEDEGKEVYSLTVRVADLRIQQFDAQVPQCWLNSTLD